MVRRMSVRDIGARLVARTGFGARPAEVDAVVDDGLEAAVRRLLGAADDGSRDEGPPPPRLEPLPPPGKLSPEERDEYRKKLNDQRRRLVLWWLDRMVVTERPWLEKRTLLWHGHWATSMQKVRSAALMLRQNETLRRLGGGDFRDLARAMVRDPALLWWLDAGRNTATAPNENLARGLMELFTLGVGHYTEDDVRQAALALSGWRIGRGDGTPRLVPRRHAPGKQTVLGKTADFTDQTLVDHLVARPESPDYLARRLWSWLVSPTPPSAPALARIVTAYGDDRDLTAMFEAMLTDEAMEAPGSVLVKQPLEWVVGAMRTLDLRPSALPAPIGQRLIIGLRGLGQVPFHPPSVGGWPSGEGWLTTSAAETRLGMATALAQRAKAAEVADAAPAERPDVLARLLGVGEWTGRTRAVLTGLQGGPPDRLIAAALCAPEYLVNR
jgi:uncharacterized protein (DUF1800 family)